MDLKYPAILEPQKEEGGYVVTFPDWPEAITQGETIAEACAEAADALEEAVAGRIVMKRELPVASRARTGMHMIQVPAPTAVKAFLYEVLRRDGRSQVELAAALGVHGREVRRLLDPLHPTKLTRVDELLGKLGYRLEVKVARIEGPELEKAPAKAPAERRLSGGRRKEAAVPRSRRAVPTHRG